jgi:hypothetical protein
LVLRSRSENEPVAGGVRAAVEAGGGDAGRDADSGRAVARRALGALTSSRLAAPAATPMNLFIGTSIGPADNRAIIATAKERVNHAECVAATRRAGSSSTPHPHTVLDEPTPPQAAYEAGARGAFPCPAVELAP